MAQIAYRAGVRSVRRFNAAFRELYGRSPSTIRRSGKISPEIGHPQAEECLSHREVGCRW
ncbi:hypothetical protein [Bradyrhizobium sp. 139]|uniref:hypothetical protein n=1 Tax=Bradyrhizobium sp. 139 TaxID=2782616 RepID=UPI0031FE555C